MARGHKTGGRTAGTPNKRTRDVAEKLAAVGLDPIAAMAKIAMDESVDIAIRAQLLKELGQYTTPKRRAVEMSGEMGLSFVDAIRQSYQVGKQDEPERN